MPTTPSRSAGAQRVGPPAYQLLLDTTDWSALETPYGDGGFLPAALVNILDPDPRVRSDAVGEALGGVIHQNSIYEATVPVAQFVAAILGHPATATGVVHWSSESTQARPTRAVLLTWLGDTAYDADDDTMAAASCLHDYPPMRAFRDLRPAFYEAVRPLLDDRDAFVRDAAAVAAIPLTEHPYLAAERRGLPSRLHRLLATSINRIQRNCAFAALGAWGYDTAWLETPDDIAVRESYARWKAAREDTSGGYTDDPPF